MSSNRRDFIKFVVAGSVAAGCPIDLALLAENAPPAVEGEHNEICHAVRDGKIFSRPPVSERHDYVIVGGGVSGLAAAYLLRDRDFLLLEKEPHFGGNAYRMEYQGDGYATGTAFIWKEDEAYPFAQELGLTPLPINSWDGTILKGEYIADTWRAGLDKLPYPAPVREAFKKWKKEMQTIDLKKREDELYNVPFSDFFKGYSTELKQWWDGYGPSNWGGISEDTAAAIGILEIQEIGGSNLEDQRYTWPGGNGALTARLAEILASKSPERMLAGATTVAVSSEKSGAHVTYTTGGELKTVAAKAVIMATPKFITRRIVEGLPDKQADAMAKLRYIPYPVVNLIFDKQIFAKGYDNWCPDGNTFTDFIVADWVLRKNQPDYKPQHNILTFYTPLREEQRGMLMTEASARRLAANVLRDFQKLLPNSNVDPLEVHIYRRGHPMYIPEAGLYKKVLPLTRVPMDRIFFANTDSEGPLSTTTQALAAARRTIKEADERLAKKV
jgi:protoporphyrinogen oxidase